MNIEENLSSLLAPLGCSLRLGLALLGRRRLGKWGIVQGRSRAMRCSDDIEHTLCSQVIKAGAYCRKGRARDDSKRRLSFWNWSQSEEDCQQDNLIEISRTGSQLDLRRFH